MRKRIVTHLAKQQEIEAEVKAEVEKIINQMDPGKITNDPAGAMKAVRQRIAQESVRLLVKAKKLGADFAKGVIEHGVTSSNGRT